MTIYRLSEIPEALLPSVGGKARGLHRLIECGFAVPDGFIVTDIRSEEDVKEACEYFKRSKLPKVAVRSSATTEDGADFSHAGQYETVLNVSGDTAFQDAVRQCLASLHNERSQKYNDTFLNTADDRMTIVVQRMIDAQNAGVLFTRDPLDDKAVLLECVDGLGEGLVSGAVSAKQYRMKDGRLSVPEGDPLPRAVVRELIDGAQKAEEKFGMPMDIEWATDDKGNVWYLQARPVTVAGDDGVTMNEFDYPFDVTDYTITTCNVGEMMPTAVTPLTMSTSMYCLDWGMRKMMESNHAVKNVDDLPAYSCITPFYNHVFFNMTTNYINAYRVAGTCKETSDISICGRVLENFPDRFADYAPGIVRVWNMIYFLPYILSYKKAKEGIDRTVETLQFNYDDTLEGLYRQSVEMFPVLQDAFYFHYCSSYYSGAASMTARNAVTPYIKDRDKIDALMSGVLTQIDGIESARIIEMMQDLALQIVNDEPNAVTYSTEQLETYLKNASGAVKESYQTFMKVNGHRGVRESEMRIDCWADDPHGFCESLKGVIATCRQQERPKKSWTSYLDEILSYVKKSKRKSVKATLERARTGVWVREYTKSRDMLCLSKYRRLFRVMAKRMVERNLLPDEDLIYFLTKEEIGQLIQGDKSLVKKAMKRRRLYPAQCALRFDEVYCGKPVPVRESPVEGVTDFKGVPASPGVTTGKVHIVTSIEEANTLQEGEIMVANCTDVGWTPYYCLASGLITEIGSCLSHGVVVAREYGLPTIVNARNILRSVKNGDMIIMDGGNGTIRIVA